MQTHMKNGSSKDLISTKDAQRDIALNLRLQYIIYILWLEANTCGFGWRHELQYSLQFKIFIDSVDYEYTYDQTIMNKDWRRGRAQYGFTRDTVWQETFERKDFHKFHGFVAVGESYLQNLGAWRPLARQKRAICKSFPPENRIFHQFVKLFSRESFPLYGT